MTTALQDTSRLGNIAKLQEAMLSMPQAEVLTEHCWANGIYTRSIYIPAGMLIVGKVHKQDHIIVLAYGSVKISDETGCQELRAGDMLVCHKGTKRAIFALEDSKWVNIHRTDERDLEKLEKELVEDDPTSAYLPGNVLKDEFRITQQYTKIE